MYILSTKITSTQFKNTGKPTCDFEIDLFKDDMLPLHDVNFDDVIYTWLHVKNDVKLHHNFIFIILKVWKSYFPHQKLIRDER